MRAEQVEERTAPSGELQLRRVLPPRNPLQQVMTRLTGRPPTSHIALDANGAFFWRLIDGRRNLFAIRAAMAKELQLDRRTAEQGVILFVKQLMRRHFLQLRMHPQRGGRVKS